MTEDLAKKIADNFKTKGLKPVQGMFNVAVRDGKFALRLDDGCCCPITAWVLGREYADAQLLEGLDAAPEACALFAKETGLDSTNFWSGFDLYFGSRHCSEPQERSRVVAMEVAKLLEADRG